MVNQVYNGFWINWGMFCSTLTTAPQLTHRRARQSPRGDLDPPHLCRPNSRFFPHSFRAILRWMFLANCLLCPTPISIYAECSGRPFPPTANYSPKQHHGTKYVMEHRSSGRGLEVQSQGSLQKLVAATRRCIDPHHFLWGSWIAIVSNRIYNRRCRPRT
jgi:hypothetical protein